MTKTSGSTLEASRERFHASRYDAIKKAVSLIKASPSDMNAMDALIEILGKACARSASLRLSHFSAWNEDGTPRMEGAK